MTYENEIKQNFGNTLRVLRKERNHSQEKIAESTGLHRTYISDIERGDRNFSLLNIIKICNALDITPSSFFLYMEKGENSRASKSEIPK